MAEGKTEGPAARNIVNTAILPFLAESNKIESDMGLPSPKS
jgi:hypothetical protein